MDWVAKTAVVAMLKLLVSFAQRSRPRDDYLIQAQALLHDWRRRLHHTTDSCARALLLFTRRALEREARWLRGELVPARLVGLGRGWCEVCMAR